VFQGLFAEFVRGKMIAFAVCNSGGSVGMLSQIVEFCDSFVRALRHSAPLTC